jgi:hypothetical protein
VPEHGRRAAGGRSTWQVRTAAARELGQIRRVVAEQAIAGELPDAELREAYLEVERRFSAAQESWLASRAGSAPADA